MNQSISYGPARRDSWIRGALTTTNQPPHPQHDLCKVQWFVWEDQVDVVFIETLTALETCTRLIAQCAFDLQAMEQRLHGLQQSRRHAYVLQAAVVAAKLSPRELQILRLVAQGLSNQAVAAELGISRGTVKNHLTSIFAKLSVSRRREAVMKAQWLGLI